MTDAVFAPSLAPGWAEVVQPFWLSPQGRHLKAFLQARAAAGATVYPSQPLRMLSLTPLDAVRVVVLGQDPYHGPGQAEGLAFSVPVGVPLPPSLRNIYQEIVRDQGGQMPGHGSLLRWAEQGVLLLNTCLTVEADMAGSHAGQGWEALTTALIQRCSASTTPTAFLLWGRHAQAHGTHIDAARHLVLTANHPSPLSARRPPAPFMGCGHFGAVNRWLAARGEKTIQWLPT